MKIVLILMCVFLVSCVYAEEMNPEKYFSNFDHYKNRDVTSPLYQKSLEMGRLDADSLQYGGATFIGFLNGYCFPFFSTIIFSNSELGNYPQSIPLSVDPQAYIIGYYSESNNDKKKKMMFSSTIGSFTALATMFLIISAVD